MSNYSKTIRPYVSKKKRKLEQEEQKLENEIKLSKVDVKSLFVTNEDVWKSTLKSSTNTSLPRKLRSKLKISNVPVWDVAWCPKYSHLLAATAENNIGMYDVMKKNTITHVYNVSDHDGVVKSLDWSVRGRRLVSCAYDQTLKIFDFLDSGKCVTTIQTDQLPNVVKWWPTEDHLVLVGGDKSYLKSFDLRSGKEAVNYKNNAGNILSFDFFNQGESVLVSGDLASRQSAELSLSVWDVSTGAKISQQIYQEHYSCPYVKTHPSNALLLAQSNGNYIGRFSTHSPYRFDKKTCYEGHKVEGYPVQFDICPDGGSIASGSSNGSIFMYQYKTSALLYTIPLTSNAVLCGLSWNPELRHVIAAADFDGNLYIVN